MFSLAWSFFGYCPPLWCGVFWSYPRVETPVVCGWFESVRLGRGPICVVSPVAFRVGPSLQSFCLSSPKFFDIFFLLPFPGATEVTTTEAPKFDGRAGSFANYEETVNLRKRISAMGPGKEAAHLLLHMSDVARTVCLSAGRGVFGNLDARGADFEDFAGTLRARRH